MGACPLIQNPTIEGGFCAAPAGWGRRARKCEAPASGSEPRLSSRVHFWAALPSKSSKIPTVSKKKAPVYDRCFLFGAADEARTRYLHLGKVALYQMSYSRILSRRSTNAIIIISKGLYIVKVKCEIAVKFFQRFRCHARRQTIRYKTSVTGRRSKDETVNLCARICSSIEEAQKQGISASEKILQRQ